MPAGATHPHAAGLYWLICGALCLCALMAEAQDADTTPASSAAHPSPNPNPSDSAAHQAHAQEVRQGLHRLSGQIAQLRETSTHTGQAQLGQGDALRQQLGGVERSQHQLGSQLSTLQQHSLQQIADLQAANRKLVVAIWALVCLVALCALGLLLAWRWRWRRASGKPQPTHEPAPKVPTHSAQQAPELPAPPIQSVPEPAPQAQTPTESPAPEAPAPDAPVEPAPPEPTPTPAPTALPWASLVAADLHSTEQALEQARASFMQPARIDF